MEVKDGGRGISTHDQKRTFQQFEWAVNANEVSGMGQGLYIGQQIMKAHRRTGGEMLGGQLL